MSKEGFQIAGEICESCRERWEKENMACQVLTNLPEVTDKYHEKVAVCSYCDGPTLKIATDNSIPKRKK